jgi:deoxyribodipyrimidine photo-lyase
MYKISVFIFRRDLRLQDNHAFYQAILQSNIVIPIFILTPEQITNNKFRSENAIQFMFEALNDVNQQLNDNNSKLFIFYGKQEEILKHLIQEKQIECIFFNHDYTPYARKRDDKIKKLCRTLNIDCKSYNDYLLNDVGTVQTSSNKPYLKFTPFFRQAKKYAIETVPRYQIKHVCSKQMKLSNEFKNMSKLIDSNPDIHIPSEHSNRKYALRILKQIKDFKSYNENRNMLTYETTHLSPYIKFGLVSIREVYQSMVDQLGHKNDLIKQLYWREFYFNIIYSFPDVLGHSMKPKYDKIKWTNNSKWFLAWKNAKTGYPVVDACMRQLNKTGYMHNRGRLIVSNFLIKILHIDWQKGEQYFATKLIDYDPAVNNGNWQWSAGTGTDSQPYFRVFNPWLQSLKFDPDCAYIKKWLPELKNISPKDIHTWNVSYTKYPSVHYVSPIVDYDEQKKKVLKLYKL